MLKLNIMKRAAIFIFAVFILCCCRKDSNKKHCWRLLDALGNAYGDVCDKSEKDMEAAYSPCNYYKLGEEEFCWWIDNAIFIKNMPQDFIDHFMQCNPGRTNAVKVACNYCQNWYTRQKNIYKPTGSFTYGMVRTERFCGDTVQVLFQGKEIILRETADSLIKLQFSSNGIF